jgi:hypothetical protein
MVQSVSDAMAKVAWHCSVHHRLYKIRLMQWYTASALLGSHLFSGPFNLCNLLHPRTMTDLGTPLFFTKLQCIMGHGKTLHCKLIIPTNVNGYGGRKIDVSAGCTLNPRFVENIGTRADG